MIDNEAINHDLVTKVAGHTAQIAEIRHQLNGVSSEIHQTSSKIDNILHMVADVKSANAAMTARADSQPHQLSLIERLQTILVVGAIVSGSVAAISYVVDGRNGARFAVLEERVSHNRDVLKDRTEAIKYIESVNRGVSRALKSDKF